MKPRAFSYRCPQDLDEALALLADHSGEAQVLAGGQSLIPTLNMRLASPGMLVDINRIEVLGGIEGRGGAIRIGALVRHAEILESPVVAERLPLLAMAIPHVAHMAVRNRGTTCGSLALADPSAEMPAVAVALDGDIVLKKRGAARTVKARNFFTGLYQTARNDDEIIAEVMLPQCKPDEVFGFAELSRRHGDFAIVGVAVRARKTPRGLGRFDVVMFGSEPTPLLCPSAKDLAIDANARADTFAELAHHVAADMNPIDSHEGRGATKRRQAAVLLRRVFADMAGRSAHA
jgi:carbon-monoxide dehydrogenase medium subunit